MTRAELLLPLTALIVAVTRSSSSSFGVSSHLPHFVSRHGSLLLWVPRGGSIDIDNHNDIDTDEEEEEEEEDDANEGAKEEKGTDDIEIKSFDESNESGEDQDPISSVISSEPVSIHFKTNIGSPLIDTSLELLVSRSRNMESVKQTLSRMLPGRPPVEALRIVWGNRLLTDDQLVDELIDEEDLDLGDDDDDKAACITLTLDMVPPVDPKFATRMMSVSELATSELLDAYTANAAAMYHNANMLRINEQQEQQQHYQETFDGSLSLELRHEAMRIREQLTTGWSETAMQKLEMEAPSTNQQDVVEERRGQRVRLGNSGATTNLRKTLQRNLNVNWPETIRNFLLFIFFGVFGGRSTTSRNLLLLGAPLTFFLQARPVKIWLKQGFYAAAHPPAILLSLLPAPQQVILSFDEAKARQALFGKTKAVAHEEKEDDDDTDDNDNSTDDE